MKIDRKKGKNGKLTDLQLKFITEYPKDWNGTQAAIRAGYSKNRADQTAYQLLRTSEIQKRLKKTIKIVSEKLELTYERIVLEYARIAFFNIRDIYDEEGKLRRIIDMDEDTSAAISGGDFIELTEEGKPTINMIKKLKTIDKKGALDSCAKILNMFKDDNTKKLQLTWEDHLDKIND